MKIFSSFTAKGNRLILAGLLSILSLTPTAHADKSYYILDPEVSGSSFDTSITPPEVFLGFKIGSRPVKYHDIRLYFKYLAEQSDRVAYAPYGETTSGHELFTIMVSSEANLSNLEAIRADIENIRGGESNLIAKTPMIAWMGYGIHGNEVSASDSAVMLAYRLTASNDTTMAEIRSKVITYIDPVHNPEGRARTLAHVDATTRTMHANDPQDMAHQEPWMNGRGNHYLFDLNRDATFQIQKQSQYRVKAVRAASPQLFVDADEMGSDDTYMFGVPGVPLNPHLPDGVHNSWLEFADDQGAAFDEINRSYYTRSWDEVFYPGYYDVWPAYLGAVSILYEQASTTGHDIEQSSGNILTFHTAVSNQYRSSIANLITASKKKDTLFARWLAAQDTTQLKGNKSYFILPGDAYKYKEALRVLLSQGIEVQQLQSPVKASGLRSYWNEAPQSVNLPAGTLRVNTNQRLGRLARNILDFHIPMSAKFLKEEKHNLDLGHETQLYDITAWSLPLAFNIETYWSDKNVKGNWSALAKMPLVEASNIQDASIYGYIYTDPGLHATARLLKAGVVVRVGKEPFVHKGKSYDVGTLLVRREDQKVAFLPLLKEEADAGHIDLVAAKRARITEGPDLGGDDFLQLSVPNIAIVGGFGISNTNFGAVWHLLDETAGIPVSLLNAGQLSWFDLTKYNVMVLPEIGDSLPVAARSAIDKWTKNGGTLITLGSASMAVSEWGLISSKPRMDMLETHPPLMTGRNADSIYESDFMGLSQSNVQNSIVLPPVLSASARAFDPENKGFALQENTRSFNEWASDANTSLPSLEKIAAKTKNYLPRGAYVTTYLKPKHWLAYGVGSQIPDLFRAEDALISGDSAELVGRYAAGDQLMLSGLIWPEANGYISGTAALVQERNGDGQVISFANDPLFRGYSLGTARLFMNALLLGNTFK